MHYVGIAGIGMSALAFVDMARGVHVTGSDPNPGSMGARLAAFGATVYAKHDPANILESPPDIVVASSAVTEENPELKAAADLGIPIKWRAEYLGLLLDQHAGPRIAISGTHGKTTTTAMLAVMLVAAGLDPDVLVGGEVYELQGNVRLGSGGAILIEACEAYDSFKHFRPDIAVVTNVEADHLDFYFDAAAVRASFASFLGNVRVGGTIVCWGDDPGVADVLAVPRGNSTVRVLKCGLSMDSDVDVGCLQYVESAHGFTAQLAARRGSKITRLGEVELNLAGLHNLADAILALTATYAMGLPFSSCAAALSQFRGVSRRQELLGESTGVVIMDDYAHHPTEIRATLQAVRQRYPTRTVAVLFQPHLFSRTRDFMKEFAEALAGADRVVVTDIYAAREQPIEGVHSRNLVERIRKAAPALSVIYAGSLEEASLALQWVAGADSVALTIGAGDVRIAGEQLLDRLRQSERGDAR